MADSQPTGGADANAVDPQQSQQPPLVLNVQYVKDLSFENPGSPQSLSALSPPPQIAVDVNVETHPIQDRTYEVVLQLRASAKRDETTFFLAELSYGGVVTVGAQVPQEHLGPLIAIEGPRMLFPFARAVIADCVRDGGFPPLLINPIDFAQMYRHMLQRRQQEQQGQQPTSQA